MVGGEIKVVMTLDNKDFSIKTVQAGKVISDLRKSMEQTAASTKAIENRFNSFGQKFRDITFSISILRFALQDVNDILLSLPRAVIGASSEIERLTKLLEGLSTGADDAARKLEAAANVKFVFDLAKNAPFEVTALTDAFVKFKSAGLDPTDGSLKALVDSVARFGGSSEQLKRASIAIQQMAGKGVISMEELRQQLGEAVPNAIRLMADGMGVSMAELVKRISKGEVEAKAALTQMTLMMEAVNGGAAEKMMDTWMGQLAQFKTNMTLLFAEVGGSGDFGFFSEVKKELKSLNAYLQSSEMKAFARDLGYAMSEVARGFVAAVRLVYQFRDAIVLAGKAYLAYFAVSKLNRLRESVTETFVSMRKAAADYVNEAVQGERRKLTAESSARAHRIATEAAAARQEIEILRKKHAEGLALENAYRANWERLDLRAHTLKTARARQRNAEMASHQFQLAMAQERANAITANSITRLQAVSVGAFGKIKAETIALKKGLEGVSVASAMMGRAIAGLRGIFAALGGWVGVTITLLATAASYWIGFGDSAEEAITRANDAIKNGYATFEDYVAKQKEFHENAKRQLELEDKIAVLKARNIGGRDIVTGGKVDITGGLNDQIKNAEAELATLQKKGVEIWRDKAKAKVLAEANANEEIIRGTDRMIEIELGKLREGYTRAYAERQAAIEKLTNKDEQKAAEEEFLKWKSSAATKLFQDEYNQVLALQAANEAAMAKVKKGSPEYNRLAAEAKAYASKVVEYSKKAEDAKNSLGQGIATISMAKDAKVAADGSTEGTLSPIDQLLHDLNTKREDLQAEIAGYEGDVAKLNYLLNNTLQYTGKKSGAPSQAEKDKALQAQVIVDKLKQDKKALDEYEAVIERLKNSQSDINTVMNDAMEAFKAGDTAAPAHLTSLNKTLADYKRALIELAEGGGEAARLAQEQLENWEATSAEMTSKANFAVLLRDAADYAEKAKLIEAGLLDYDLEAKRAREEAELKSQQKQLQIRYDAAVASKRYTEIELQAMKDALDSFGRFSSARIKQIARETRKPMEELADNWRNVTKQLEDATTGWANQTIDMMMEFVKTGKLQFKELLESILTDILRIQLQKQMSEMLEGVFGELTKVLGGVLGGKTPDSRGQTPAYDAQKNAQRVTIVDNEATGGQGTPDDAEQQQKTFLETIKEKLSAVWSWAKNMFTNGWDFLKGLFAKLGGSLNDIFDSLWTTLKDFGGDLMDMFSNFSFGGSSDGGGFFDGIDWGSLATEALSWFGFAKGGVMTPGGPLDLKAYANGGIANRPQLALFGEGDMSEAFVPLPDGRSIPVTMTGARAGTIVNVNVHEAAGTQASVQQRQDENGNLTLDIMIEKIEGKMAKNVSRGSGSLSKSLESTYGLNRKPGSYR